jgi:tripartite-type tricarboxylate transporter receptor subunit TctC
VASSWNAVAAPRGTPAFVVKRLNDELVKALAQPDVRDKLAAAGVTARSSTPEELSSLLAADVLKWKRVIDRAKIERQ